MSEIVRELALLDGYMSKDQLKAELAAFTPGERKPSDRTIARLEKKGLPVVVIGNLHLYPITQGRSWLAGYLCSHRAPRKRGRPRDTLNK